MYLRYSLHGRVLLLQGFGAGTRQCHKSSPAFRWMVCSNRRRRARKGMYLGGTLSEHDVLARRTLIMSHRAAVCRGEGANREEKEALNRQKEEQHRLKVQLEDLVTSLKASTTLIYSNLKDQNQVRSQTPSPCRDEVQAASDTIWLVLLSRRQVLDKTGDAAVKNLEGLEQDIKKTEEHLRKAWSNSFTSCLMIIVVLATFVATFLFMRLFPKRRLLLW